MFDSETGKAAVQKRKNPSGGKTASITNNLKAKQGEVATTVNNVRKWWGRRSIKSDEEYEQKMLAYFDECIGNDEIPTIEKMCVALGITRNTLWEWGRGSQGAERQRLVQLTKEMFAAIDAELAIGNKIPVVSYIFRSKNFYGMVDEQKVTVQPTSPLGDEQRKEDIARLYQDATKDLPIIEGDFNEKKEEA